MKGVKLVAAVLLSGTCLFAQSHNWAGDFLTGKYLSAGSMNLNLKSLNDYIKAQGLKPLGTRPLSVELGNHVVIQQLVLESAIGGIFWKPVSLGNRQVSLISGYGMATMGVNFALPGSSWEVYPYFNVGCAVFRLASHDQNLKFGDNNTASSSSYLLPTFFTGTGAAILHVFYDDQNHEVFTFGVKAGVMIDPTKQSVWYSNGARFAGGPSPLFSGPYVQVVLGKGAFRK